MDTFSLRDMVRSYQVHDPAPPFRPANPGALRAASILSEDPVNRGHGSKLGRKMEAAVAALLTQRTIEEAARVAGVSVSTLVRWQKVPEFRAALRERSRATTSQFYSRMQQAANAAGSVVLKLMADPNTPPACRLRVAEKVLDYGIHGVEMADVEDRLATVERGARLPIASPGLPGVPE